MSHGNVHYELFVKPNKKSGWSLVEANPDRQAALKLAKEIEKKNPAGSVRVSKETWVAEKSGFNSVAIYTYGPDPFDDGKDEKAEASLPCVTPEDLAGAAARDTIRRVLSGWFERREVTPLELLHRPELIEDLEDDDTELQHAVQKVAIARAQNSDVPVQSYIKLINTLVEKTIAQARKEIKASKPLPKANSFAEQAEKILGAGGGERHVRKAISQRLSDRNGFSDKAGLLLDLLDDQPSNDDHRAVTYKSADAFLAETVSFDGGRRALLGQTSDLGQDVVRLTGIYEAKPESEDLKDAPHVARKLAQQMSKAELPNTQDEVACHILDALRAPKRFRPDSVMEEVTLARQLAMRLIVISGDRLHPESLVEAFTYRSARLLSNDAITDLLDGAKTPVEEIERLFEMEDNLVGDTNKSKLASYVRAQLKTSKAERYFVYGDGQPFERLGQLTALQTRCEKSTLNTKDKQELSEAFDGLGMQILDGTKIFDRITQSAQPPLDQATGLLKLAAQGVLPQGRCVEDAKARSMRILSSDMGRKAAGDAKNIDKLQTIKQLMTYLNPVDIDASPTGKDTDKGENEGENKIA